VIVLDTNVVSALMQEPVDGKVLAWLDMQPRESVWTTAITVFEIRFGLERLSTGRRRTALESAFEAILVEEMDNRVLAFDSSAADQAAKLAARRQRAGRPQEIRDTQIAGIVLARGGTLATRDTDRFFDLKKLVNPWRE
jgi:hypothetical protein